MLFQAQTETEAAMGWMAKAWGQGLAEMMDAAKGCS
jgi:hypothetical protein